MYTGWAGLSGLPPFGNPKCIGRSAVCKTHRYPQRSFFPVVFGDVHPSDRLGFVPRKAQVLLKQFPSGFWSVVHYSINPCGVFPLVFLGNASDRQECVGRGSNKQLLEIFHLSPCFVHRGAVNTLLQASYIPFHGVPMDVGPRRAGLFFSPFDAYFHRLTSPKMRTLLEFSTVRTTRKSAPFRVGYVRVCGPVRPIIGRRSLFPSSPTLCSVPLPCDRDTTSVGSIGLTQLSMKKSVGRFGWSLYPGERGGCRRPQPPKAVLPAYHCGCGLSASLATWGSRGFMPTLHGRSTFPPFPSLDSHEHESAEIPGQSFA